MKKHYAGRTVYIVDGARSPFLKAREPGKFSAADLAVGAARELLARQPISPEEMGETIFGCMMPSPDETNIGRLIGYRAGCGKYVPGWTVQRNCASGLQALDSALKDIALGRHDVVLAGGTDAMSRAPLLYNDQAVNWFAKMSSAKGMMAKLKLFFKLRPSMFFAPVISLIRGLTDPMCTLIMGKTAENVAYKFNITRKEMDEYAVESHLRAAKAIADGVLKDEIVPFYDTKGKVYDVDDGVRADSSVAKLSKLKPFFDRKYGAVTAANSSQITDGAAVLLLASAEAVKKYNFKVLAKIVDVNWAGLDPAYMGLGPVYAATPILKRNNLTINNIDYWEINEAFAAQVIGCVRAWQDEKFCREELKLEQALGSVPMDKLNIDGGAIALGHPVGASGARITLHLANILRRKHAKLGLASICIGGGLGGAILIESVDHVDESGE
ncbi:MAG: acetyl-CoA C-acetyltransferase [Gammaproteobacteria bacterium]|nr:acetyl-CoA C-acetyltransferase [Gammaproteobacteria bacterium]